MSQTMKFSGWVVLRVKRSGFIEDDAELERELFGPYDDFRSAMSSIDDNVTRLKRAEDECIVLSHSNKDFYIYENEFVVETPI